MDSRSGLVVGRGGFHGPPDENGLVEVGYSVDPMHRRKGYARAALRAMLEVAHRDVRIRTLRVTIGPDNEASTALVIGEGLERVGEQWDDEDGREIVFEICVQGGVAEVMFSFIIREICADWPYSNESLTRVYGK